MHERCYFLALEPQYHGCGKITHVRRNPNYNEHHADVHHRDQILSVIRGLITRDIPGGGQWLGHRTNRQICPC